MQIEGERGDLTQSSASDYDIATNVLFLTQLNRDGVACWNTNKPLSSETLGLVAQDKEALIFTNDLKVNFGFLKYDLFEFCYMLYVLNQ